MPPPRVAMAFVLGLAACSDGDRDGYRGRADCDDDNAAIHPAVQEVCDGVDNDCDGLIDDLAYDAPTWYADGDHDGYGNAVLTLTACSQPEGYTSAPKDCDDSDPAFHPNAEEADCADEHDYNCDGSVGYVDADGDGVAACEGDCDDTNASAHPGKAETCDSDDVDEDCDGLADDDDDDTTGLRTWWGDLDQDGYGNPDVVLEACEKPDGYVTGVGLIDCDDSDPDISPEAVERCDDDDLDEDCDGPSDDHDAVAIGRTPWYADLDQDGYGDPDVTLFACDAPMFFVDAAGDCDDQQPDVNSGSVELCDAGDQDEDCDGSVEDDDTDVEVASLLAWYADLDDDGYGDALASTLACEPPDGTVADNTDCDDAAVDVHPGAIESCDLEDRDDDCDGLADDSDPSTAASGMQVYFVDADGDGFGADGAPVVACDPAPNRADNDDDCDDGDSTVSPGGAEICDGKQNDCDAATWSEAGLVSVFDSGAWSNLASTGADGAPELYSPPGGSIVQICEGTHYLNLALAGSVDIAGIGDASDIVIDGGGFGPVVAIDPGVEVGIANLTITGGGIGIDAPADSAATRSIDLVDVTVSDNLDGGLVMVGGTLGCVGCQFVGNSTAGSGAGARLEAVLATVSDSAFSDNVAAVAGGGLYLLDSEVAVTSSTFEHNHAPLGGGLFVSGTDASSSGCTYADNTDDDVYDGTAHFGVSIAFSCVAFGGCGL